MATLATAAVRDNSTLANFKQWAQVISNFFTTAGWTKSTDTGQVNWSTIAAVPAASTYVYEIWEPNDGLTNFYLKVEYGTDTASSNTAPQMRLSISTSTNGAGTLGGLVAGPFVEPYTTTSVTSTTTQWNCYLSGAAGRFNCAMWVNDSTNFGAIFFGVARSKNSSGANTSVHATLVGIGYDPTYSYSNVGIIVFGMGVANQVQGVGNPAPPIIHTGLSNLFGGGIAISPLFPNIGYYDNPLIEIAGASAVDVSDQGVFTIAAAKMPYGTAHTYIGLTGSGKSPISRFINNNADTDALVMLWE